MNTKQTALLVFLAISLLSPAAHAERQGLPGPVDARVKTLLYDENEVYRVTGHYGYTPAIEIAENEKIETISVGDSVSWQIIKPARPNILFIKPLEQNAETNMTVFTSRRVYSFRLSSGTAGSDDLTFRLKFLYPKEKAVIKNGETVKRKFDLMAGHKPSEWNFAYSYAGAERFKPERAFDDGTFTYLEFKAFENMPAVFLVDEDGNESVVNFTTYDRYLVIKRTGRQFTLRDGDTATCIFNDAYPDTSGIQKRKTKIVPISSVSNGKNAPPIPKHKPEIGKTKTFPGSFFERHGFSAVSPETLND